MQPFSTRNPKLEILGPKTEMVAPGNPLSITGFEELVEASD